MKLHLDCNKVKVCLCCLHCLLFACAVQRWIPLLHGIQFNLKSFVCNPSPPPLLPNWFNSIGFCFFFKIHCTFSKYKHSLNCIDVILEYIYFFISRLNCLIPFRILNIVILMLNPSIFISFLIWLEEH